VFDALVEPVSHWPPAPAVVHRLPPMTLFCTRA